MMQTIATYRLGTDSFVLEHRNRFAESDEWLISQFICPVQYFFIFATLFTLGFLATVMFYRETGDRAGISPPTVS